MRQRDSHTIAAGERFDRAIEILFTESKPGQNTFGLVFGILVAVRRIKDRFTGERF